MASVRLPDGEDYQCVATQLYTPLHSPQGKGTADRHSHSRSQPHEVIVRVGEQLRRRLALSKPRKRSEGRAKMCLCASDALVGLGIVVRGLIDFVVA